MVSSSSSIQSKIKIKTKNKKNVKGVDRKFSQLDDIENSKKPGHVLNCQTKSSMLSIKVFNLLILVNVILYIFFISKLDRKRY